VAGCNVPGVTPVSRTSDRVAQWKLAAVSLTVLNLSALVSPRTMTLTGASPVILDLRREPRFFYRTEVCCKERIGLCLTYLGVSGPSGTGHDFSAHEWKDWSGNCPVQ
jgi:hypothetical protein